MAIHSTDLTGARFFPAQCAACSRLKIEFSSLALLFLSLAACGHDSSEDSNGYRSETDPGPFQLTFSLDESFHMPHGNEPIRIALVGLNNGAVLAEDIGTVSSMANPSFIFTTSRIMERGQSYAVRYWIDSNINGGTLGLCDDTEFDHQWSTEFFTVTNNIDFSVGYEPNLLENVCNTFP